jgi:hypothetical protein
MEGPQPAGRGAGSFGKHQDTKACLQPLKGSVEELVTGFVGSIDVSAVAHQGSHPSSVEHIALDHDAHAFVCSDQGNHIDQGWMIGDDNLSLARIAGRKFPGIERKQLQPAHDIEKPHEGALDDALPFGHRGCAIRFTTAHPREDDATVECPTEPKYRKTQTDSGDPAQNKKPPE